MSIRTDMAAESFSQAGGAEKLQGVKVKNKVIENARLEVTDITIETQEAAEKLGRPVGRFGSRAWELCPDFRRCWPSYR